MTQHDNLTPNQRRAVEHTEGPLLVLAGPGSGKTRVITRRIAQIIENGVHPSRVLAITFTNKASAEMAERVSRLLPGARIWISTFHRFCARLLRSRAEAVGLKPNFTIADADDQRRLVREVVKKLNFDTVNFPPERLAARISLAKNDLLMADAFVQARQERIGDLMDSVLVQVYPEYQRRLMESNSVDFDDLLLHVVQLLKENPEIRHELDTHFRYILVDEYQDTNQAQYQIVAGLSRDYPNLCVTGDPDQSIYRWRGARIENILRFEADYPEAEVIRLEENFRSTKSILAAADRLIAWNVHRKAKTMRTDNPEGAPVELLQFENAQAEAEGIARQIQQSVEAGLLHYSEVAVFYRINALSRELERMLAKNQIPFQVASGFAFYERAEIKDVLGYLRLIVNPRDRAAFLRTVNVPARGIGKVSLQRLQSWAETKHLTLLEAAARAPECPEMPRKSAKQLFAFAELITDLSQQSTPSVRETVGCLLEQTGYARDWQNSDSEIDLERWANVNELLNAAAEYDTENESPTLEGFLETTALVSDVDSVEGNKERVTLMTLHSAKGLEFPVVFIVGVEHGLVPYERAVRADDPGEYEEERRLLFVGMTRARQRLFLTRAENRATRGLTLRTIPSDFLREIGLAQHETFSSVESAVVEAFEARSKPPSSRAGEAPRNDQHDSTTEITAAIEERRPQLMTGADLLAGNFSREARVPGGFAVGMAVRHPRYGLGRVTKVSGFTRDGRVTVEFHDDGRSETFVAGKNPLQPVGLG